MNNRKYYIAEVAKIIDLDPTTIELTRTVTEDDGYGGETATTTSHSIKGRLYNKKTVRELLDISGQRTSFAAVAAEKLLCLPTEDIEEGDTFTVENRKYKVSMVKNYLDICQQIELTVIKT